MTYLFSSMTHAACKQIISLHIRSMWETTVMHKQVSGWTVNFGSKFSRKPLSGIEDQKAPPTILENFRFGMTKVYSGIPPPPISENFRFGMTKVYSGIPPPSLENFRFGMTQSLLQNTPPPHFGKLQIWDDQSLLRNTPPMKIVRESNSRFSEYRELLHMETLSNPDNY